MSEMIQTIMLELDGPGGRRTARFTGPYQVKPGDSVIGAVKATEPRDLPEGYTLEIVTPPSPKSPAAKE
jgi:hypothetical protein